MRIFWSWQSDSPGNIGRHFVKDAIEEAIRKLQEEVNLDEPERDLHLDHDRKGVPGSPDLANTILAKIRESSVFIADVTPVGKTCDKKKKAILNPNVAIELGYALAHIGDNGLLMVLNSAYGDRETLLFDLRQKAGPIVYNLKSDATKEQRAQERALLVGNLKTAIRDCIAALKANDVTVASKHIETECKANCSAYFDYGEPLAEREVQGKKVAIAYNRCPLLYLRLIAVNRVPRLRRSEAKGIVYGIKIAPLRNCVGGGASWAVNRYGAVTYSFESMNEGVNLLTSSEVFLNREIWGLDATILAGGKFLSSIDFERLF